MCLSLADEGGWSRLGALVSASPCGKCSVAELALAGKEAWQMVQMKCNFFSFFKHLPQYIRPHCDETHQAAVVKDAALVLFVLEEWQE